MLLCIAILSMSCSESKTAIETKEDGGKVTEVGAVFTNSYDLNEFEYKGHTYIYCHVRDGIAITHAGHCACNNKK